MENIGSILARILGAGGPQGIDPKQEQRYRELAGSGAGIPDSFTDALYKVRRHGPHRKDKDLIAGATSALRLSELPDLQGEEVADHLVNVLQACNIVVGRTLAHGGVDPSLLFVAALVDQASRWCDREGLDYFDAFIGFLQKAKENASEHNKTCPFHSKQRNYGKDSFSPDQIREGLIALMERQRAAEDKPGTGDPAVDELVAALTGIFGPPTIVELKREPGESDESFIARARAKEEELLSDPSKTVIATEQHYKDGTSRRGVGPLGAQGFFDPQGGPIGRGPAVNEDEATEREQVTDEEEASEGADTQADGVK